MKNIKIKSPNKSIIYSDTKEHFENGLLRLLNLDIHSFNEWIKLSELSNELNLIDKLSEGFMTLYPLSLENNGIFDVERGPQGEMGSVLFSKIAENDNYGIASSGEIAWLIKQENNKWIREIKPPIYEEDYFEGEQVLAGGYSNYGAQEIWRLEKSKRQVTELSNITGLKSGYVLDIGSGYGYFRKALNDANFKHEGIEISKFAKSKCKEMFGFDCYLGILSDYLNEFKNIFDIVVLNDMIEHIADPIVLLKEIYAVLKPGGFIIIKTPNIDCPEISIFGANYHSFKREHLIYFSNTSIINYANKANLNHYKSTSISHLLRGFVGAKQTTEWAENLQGSDLVIYLKKS